jgi:hypothetical protein
VHINVGELLGTQLAIQKAAAARPNARHIFVGDSQVITGCCVKGRSASPALNSYLCAGLPTILGANIYPLFVWVPSAVNPADDPMRDVELRRPTKPPPDWYIAACLGDFARVDEVSAADDAHDTRALRFPDLQWATRAPPGVPNSLAAH